MLGKQVDIVAIKNNDNAFLAIYIDTYEALGQLFLEEKERGARCVKFSYT